VLEWTGLTGDGRTAVFLYNKHRSGAAALLLLNGSAPGDYLMVDDCPSYNKPVKELKLIMSYLQTLKSCVESSEKHFYP
jgi:hypothetical protein